MFVPKDFAMKSLSFSIGTSCSTRGFHRVTVNRHKHHLKWKSCIRR
jgi:hypothetical protein